MIRGIPRKHKARRPELRGITRALSPKQSGERKRGNVSSLRNTVEKRRPGARSERFSPHIQYWAHSVPLALAAYSYTRFRLPGCWRWHVTAVRAEIGSGVESDSKLPFLSYPS